MKNIYIIYGDNYKKIFENRREILEESKVDEMNISIFDMNKESLKKAISDAFTMPFLCDYRVVVLTNVSFLTKKPNVIKELVTKESDDDINDLINYSTNPMESTILILEVPYSTLETKNDKLKDIFKNSEIIECKYPTENELTSTIKDYISKKDYQIDKIALEELVKRISYNIESYENELLKIIYYKASDKTIKIEDVKKIISYSPSDVIYNLTKSIVNKSKDESYKIYSNLIDNGYEPFQILSYLTNRFKEFLIVKEIIRSGGDKKEVSEYLKISEGKAYYMINDSRNLSYTYLSYLLNKLKEVDYNLKVDFKYGEEVSLPIELFFLDI